MPSAHALAGRQAQDFAWGVLAINPDKAVYRSGETARVGMAVLDDKGRMVCDASLWLEVTGPGGFHASLGNGLSGKGIRVNRSACATKGFTERPDYEAVVPLGGPGEYKVRLTAVSAAGKRTMDDTWRVEEHPPLEVQRTGPTRTYPRASYRMRLRIVPSEDVEGIVEERLPPGFAVSLLFPSGTVQAALGPGGRSGPDPTLLRWNVRWKAGEVYELEYEFRPTRESPDFFLLGGLRVHGNTPGMTVLTEPRQWQIANDDVTGNLSPVADGSISDAGWVNGAACESTDCYVQVDDDPASPDDATTVIQKTSQTGISITFDLDESSIPDGSTITDIDITFRCDRPNGNNTATLQSGYQVDGGGFQASGTNAACPKSSAGFSTFTQTFTGLSIAKSSSTDLEVGVLSSQNRDTRVTMIYAVVTYTPPAPPASAKKRHFFFFFGF